MHQQEGQRACFSPMQQGNIYRSRSGPHSLHLPSHARLDLENPAMGLGPQPAARPVTAARIRISTRYTLLEALYCCRRAWISNPAAGPGATASCTASDSGAQPGTAGAISYSRRYAPARASPFSTRANANASPSGVRFTTSRTSSPGACSRFTSSVTQVHYMCNLPEMLRIECPDTSWKPCMRPCAAPGARQ